MAEAFANHYGSDVVRATSAGLAPIQSVAADTVDVMIEKNIDVSWHMPRRYDPFDAMQYDLVVNMSGYKLPGLPPAEVVEWQVTDPYGAPMELHRGVRDDLEHRVMRLILAFRKQTKLSA